jgi:hypothetical protein
MAAGFLLLAAAPGFAGDVLSASGSLQLSGVIPLNSSSATEIPSLLGRLKLDTPPGNWYVHARLEGGWDGTVHLPAQDHAILKNFEKVYQSNTPYLEIKELYGAFSTERLELRAGIQRFSWGRLDEYPVNDLLNPWDYTRFIRKPLEDRKIGVPSLSARLGKDDWSLEAVWVPLFVPYRLPLPNERWSGFSGAAQLTTATGITVEPDEAVLPGRILNNSSVGLRLRQTGPVDWSINLFHGYDPRPVFKTTRLVITPTAIDPGYQPDFHKMTSVGIDAATVAGEWSLRGEAAYSVGRYFNTRWDLWGYPLTIAPGIYPLLPNEKKSDAIDYGIGIDYRLFEECLLTMQVQQSVILDRPETLFARKLETIVWGNIKTGWLNQRLETNLNIAYNPEHSDYMVKANAMYTFNDSWKGGITAVMLAGDEQSVFGRYSRNDQLEAEIVYSW